MAPTTLPELNCKSESDVEQKLIYPLLSHPSFLGIPDRCILSKRSLGTFPFVDKAALPKNYIPDYVVFFDGFPACVVEAKEPRESIDQAIREARLYAQTMNQHFPSGTNPICVCVGCNGVDIAFGAPDTNEYKKYSVSDLLVGSSAIQEINSLFGVERQKHNTSRARRNVSPGGARRPSSFMNSELFIERVRQNSLSPYLNQVNEMFFRAEDPEKIQLILDEAYVDTADLREYDNVLHAMLKQIESRSEQKPISTDKKREYTLSPEITRYGKDLAQGRLHLIVGARGSGKSLFIARFFSHLFPPALRATAAWLVVDFNKAPENLGNLEEFLFERLIEDIQNIGLDQFSIEGLCKIFSVELNRLKKGPLSLLKNEEERERQISNELMRASNDKRAFGKAIARYIVGDCRRPLVVAFDNVDRRRSEQQLAIFQAAQSFRSTARAFSLLTLRDTTFERYKDEPPLDTLAQINNFYIRPPSVFISVAEKIGTCPRDWIERRRRN